MVARVAALVVTLPREADFDETAARACAAVERYCAEHDQPRPAEYLARLTDDHRALRLLVGWSFADTARADTFSAWLVDQGGPALASSPEQEPDDAFVPVVFTDQPPPPGSFLGAIRRAIKDEVEA